MAKKLHVYLAGRMGSDPYHRQWREDITKSLQKMGFAVWDPYVFEPNLKETDMRTIIRYDMGMVRSKIDIVICYWDKHCDTGGGTHAELTEAFLKNIPIYCVATASLPAWQGACVTAYFKTFDELLAYMEDENDR